MTSSWLAIATAAATIVLNAVGLVQVLGQQSRIESLQTSRGVSSSDAHSAVVVTTAVVVVLTILYSVLLVLFARWMRQGHPRSRVVVTVLCALSLLTIIGFGPGAIAGLLAAFTIVFAWLPASSDWFRTARGTTPRV